MKKSLLPPRGVYIRTNLLFSSDIPEPVLFTLFQLIALAWGNPARLTPPISYQALSDLTRKGVRTLFGHLAVLRNKYSALHLQTIGDGTFVVELAEWVLPPEKPAKEHCNSLQLPVKEKEEDSMDESCIDSPPPPPSEEEFEGKPRHPRGDAKFDKRKPARQPPRELSPGLSDRLLAAGVFKGLLDEVARSRYSEEDLLALLAWSEAEHTSSTAGLFMYHVRARDSLPEAYQQPPCRYCGMLGGKHAPDCRGRYVSGPYADFIEH
jgi:hypothetical protein